MSKIFIATPCYGKMVLEGYMKSLLKTMQALPQRGHTITLGSFGNESLITRARNNLMAQFLSSDCEYLLFIDSDITWNPEAIIELIESGHDVCGIPYPTKSFVWDRILKLIQTEQVHNIKTENQLRDKARIFTINKVSGELKEKSDKGWVEVSALGTGFLLIKRAVLETMRDHYWNDLYYVNDIAYYNKTTNPKNCVALFDTLIDPVSRRYLSEDYAFCKRWIDIGGKIQACLKHRLVHTGTADF